jgi:threonine aldolase
MTTEREIGRQAHVIDLRSDTVTRPSSAMREAMANAEVGDDVLDRDPTTLMLEQRTAALLGKERALFFPTGSMANQAAIWLHGAPGSEIVVDGHSHIMLGEMAGAAGLAGVQMRTVDAAAAGYTAAELRAFIRPVTIDDPERSLVCVENTHNGGGGAVIPVEELRAIQEVAREHALPVHLDGARLWNASAASGTSLSAFASTADTVMVSFSKGLGAPVGAALAGTTRQMERAHRIRKRLGGGMRQSGIIAAGALYGLEHNLARLADDHAAAKAFASIVDGAGGARVVPPDTNIVMIDLPFATADVMVERVAARGVLLLPWLPNRVRAVTHLDAPLALVRRAAEIVREELAN